MEGVLCKDRWSYYYTRIDGAIIQRYMELLLYKDRWSYYYTRIDVIYIYI
jgi:hypothetical protein